MDERGFAAVVGHNDIIEHLQNATKSGKISHAYLFTGEPGSGKKLMATLFATLLQCEKGRANPCMKCASCKKALSQNHPDIIMVTHEKQNVITVNMNHTAGADYLTFTVLALPKDYDQLSVRFTTSQGLTRTLALKYSDTATSHTQGSYVKFAAGKKHRIYGLLLPTDEWKITYAEEGMEVEEWIVSNDNDQTFVIE